jgi:hypothetical protein
MPVPLQARSQLTTDGGASDGGIPNDAGAGASPNGDGATPNAFCAGPNDAGRANAIADASDVPSALVRVRGDRPRLGR